MLIERIQNRPVGRTPKVGDLPQRPGPTPVLIRAFCGPDGTWHGTDRPPRAGIRHPFPFFPTPDDPLGTSPFAGRLLVLDIGRTTTPPGWTRFHLLSGIHYATDIVCWLLFGSETPGCWPPTRFCETHC